VRVLHIGANCSFAGAETVSATLIREQKKAGIEADAFFLWNMGGGPLFDGLCNVWFPEDRPLTEVLLAGDYDLVHIVAAAAGAAGISLRRALYRGAVVITSHGAFGDLLGCKYVVAVSKFGAEEIQPACSSPVYVVYNGIDLTRFGPAPAPSAERPIIAWVGRSNDAQKDYGGLLALSASGMVDDYEILVVDNSPDESEPENWLSKNGSVVRKMPWHEMPDLYRRVAASGGCLLSTARVEWCPMSILEAEACGCPVIAPAVGGIPEIILHENTGYVYDKKKGLGALRAAFDWLRTGDQQKRASAAAVEYIARNFSAEKMFREYQDIYTKAIAENRPGPINRFAQRILLTAARPAIWTKRRRKRARHGR
jgi:glycosyltransferase involved in cell wall biosynthesis